MPLSTLTMWPTTAGAWRETNTNAAGSIEAQNKGFANAGRRALHFAAMGHDDKCLKTQPQPSTGWGWYSEPVARPISVVEQKPVGLLDSKGRPLRRAIGFKW
jgi:hypothetical protein